VCSQDKAAVGDGFTAKDREILNRNTEILIELKVKVEEHEKRLDRIEARLDFQFEVLLGAMGVIITAIIGLVGFILWDRRTYIKPVQSNVEEVKTKFTSERAKTENMLAALREL